MREIIFDTETTGLENKNDRVIEIGGIELFNHFPTGNTIHFYINPGDRKVHPDALAVHGISDDFLKDKPPFSEVAPKIIEFFEGAKWIAHNAAFDMGFINAEFARLNLPAVPGEFVVDTLAMARRKNPMGPNTLDALCRRYGIDNSHRTKHGALLDAELLAEVYIEMIGGRQAAFGLTEEERRAEGDNSDDATISGFGQRPRPLASRMTQEERDRHAAMVATLKGTPIWSKYENQA